MSPEEMTLPLFSGRKLNILNPTLDQICLEDIAHGLAGECRYANHTNFHYSVAEHSVHLSLMVPGRVAKMALLHDASEAYLLDMPRPIKILPEMAGYRAIEGTLQRLIYRKYDVNGFGSPEEVDLHALDQVFPVGEAMAGVIPFQFDSSSPKINGEDDPNFQKRVQLVVANLTETCAVGMPLLGWNRSTAKSVFLARAKELGVRD